MKWHSSKRSRVTGHIHPIKVRRRLWSEEDEDEPHWHGDLESTGHDNTLSQMNKNVDWPGISITINEVVADIRLAMNLFLFSGKERSVITF